ncbi:hypothetical protein RKD24_005397 [Streptomyces calvus]
MPVRISAPRAPQRVGDREREGAHSAGDAREHRAGLRCGGGPGLDLADALGQGGVGAGGLEQLRDRRAHRDAVRVPRVHPAQQGLHQPVDDLPAEARRHELADRDVVADLGARQVGVPLDAGEPLLGQHPGERGGRARHAHDVALGHGAQGAAGPQRGGGGGRRPKTVGEAHLAGETDRLRAAGQQRLGAEVHARARDLAGQQLAADPVRRLQHGHPCPVPQQPVRGGQPGDSGSDDDGPTAVARM